jgi:replicative DNA helicase
VATRKQLPKNQGLPVNIEAEQYVLGSILMNGSNYASVAEFLSEGDFALHKHQIIYRRIQDLYRRGDHIDRVTVANELLSNGELESVDGIAYLSSLDAGLPELFNLQSYVRIIRSKSAGRRMIFTCRNAAQSVMGGSDPLEAMNSMEGSLHEIESFLSADRRILNPGELIEVTEGGINAVLSPMASPPISTGYPKLDEIIYGIIPGKVYTLGGDVTGGKSAFALNISHYIARKDTPVLFFSLEMSREDLIQRMVASEAMIPLWKIKRNLMDYGERRDAMFVMKHISHYPIYIDDDGFLTVSDLHAKISRMVREKAIKLVVIDYLQIMDWQNEKNPIKFHREEEAIPYITRNIHMYAKRFGVAILLVSQLSRARARRTSDLKPKLSDLHGSSSIEKDSDVVMFMYREEMDKPNRAELKGKAELLVRKHRNGPQGDVNMRFEGQFTRFVEVDSTASTSYTSAQAQDKTQDEINERSA